MEQRSADWVDRYYTPEMESARSRCHDSYVHYIDALLRVSCDAARGVTDFEASDVPKLLLDEIQGESRELLKSNINNVWGAFSDAHRYILERSRERVENGQTVPRDANEQRANAREIIETSQGKKTRTAIMRVIRDGIQLHVGMFVDAWEARKKKFDQDCDVAGLHELLGQGMTLFYNITILNRNIGFSDKAMERYKKALTRDIQGDLTQEVAEVLHYQTVSQNPTQYVMEIIQDIQRRQEGMERRQEDMQRRQEDMQHLQEEMSEETRSIHEGMERDMPPRFFLLVPPLNLPLIERFPGMVNPCSKQLHVYFVCQTFMNDVRKLGREITAESMNPSPEFSKPLLVKQSAAFVERHNKVINFALKITNIFVKVAAKGVALDSIIPAFKVANFKRLKKMTKDLRAQIGEHDWEMSDYEYERLRAFLTDHHHNEWQQAVKAKLKLAILGRNKAHVCKENESHETEWRRSINPTFST